MTASEHVLSRARDLRGTDLEAMGAPTGFVVQQCGICRDEGFGSVAATVRLRANGVARWDPNGYRLPSRRVEQDVCRRHADSLVQALTGGSPSQRAELHAAARRDVESMTHDVLTPGITPSAVHHVVVSAQWAPDPAVEFWCRVAGVWTDVEGRFGHQLGLRTTIDSELANYAVTTLDEDGIQASAQGVIAAGRGVGRFRDFPRDSDLTGYVQQIIVTSMEAAPWEPESKRVGLGLFCVDPSSCFIRHGGAES